MLGSSCSIPRPGRASSSYLLEAAGRAIVADLGTGAFANLLRVRPAESLDAVVISHMHADHFIDVLPLRYALKYGKRTHARRLPLFLPPGGEAILRGLVAPFGGEQGEFLDDVFEIATYDPERTLAIGDVAIRFAKTTHYIPCYAMRLEVAGLAVTYSADTAPDDAVTALARAADVFVCEATLAAEEESLEPRGHLSAREAGGIASAAAVGSLVLSHYPASADPAALARGAAAAFAGPVRVADDGDRIALGG